MENVKNKTILIVEDESLIALYEAQLLKNFGYDVIMVNSGEKAIKSIEQNCNINMVLMDIDLGIGIDGEETSRQILKLKNIPIVFLTSHSEEEYVEKVKEISRYGLIIKNSGEFVLKSTIESAFALFESYMQTKLNEEYLNQTLQSIGDGVIVTDKNGHITKMNPIAENLCGWIFEEAKDKHISEVFQIINENSRESIQNPTSTVLKEDKIVELANHTILISKSKIEYYISDTAAPIHDHEGNLIGVVLTFSDITEKHRLIEATQRNQKLEAIGLLASGIAHDFNNLLGGIYGYIDLVLTDTKEDNTYECLTSAKNTIDRAKNLTHQLLTFSKGGDPIKKPEIMKPIITNTVKFALSGSNTSVSFDIEEELWACFIDKNQISQVIDNITINAMQAMNESGHLKISAKNFLVNESQYPNLEKGKYVQISFNDNGKGIPIQIINQIFDPFFTTKDKGHGLGLSTSYSIINKHHGIIEVISEENVGTTFDIYLPAIDQANEETKQSVSIHQSQGKILILDDEEFFHSLYEKMLSKSGYSVLISSEGVETIEQFKKDWIGEKEIKALILDLTIPGGLGGKEVIKEIRKLDQNIPVFASSGYSNDPIISSPKAYGFTASISKPFSFEELSEFISINIQNDIT